MAELDSQGHEFRCTLIVNTCRRPRNLRRVLVAYLDQLDESIEVIVAEDGQSRETSRVVQEIRLQTSAAVIHIHQQHQGHRRTVILNRAIRYSRAPYLIFSDEDCLPSRDLLAQHMSSRDAGRMLVGGFVKLRREDYEGRSEAWFSERGYEACLTSSRLLGLYFRHLKNLAQIQFKKRRRPHNHARNLSLWRSDLHRVNGFDENFRGWGSADGDLRDRLCMVGVVPKSIWHRAIVFHLDHPPDPSKGERHKNRSYARRSDRSPYASRGLR